MSSIILTSSNVPANFCHRTWQETWNALWPLLSANFDGTASAVRSGTEPAPADRDKSWFRLNSNGSPDRVYNFFNGQWVSPHPVPPGVVVMYEGVEAAIPTFDGGEAGVIAPTTGPMWEKVAQLNGRSPIGPGALPSPSILVLAPGDSGGEEKHIQTVNEMARHHHGFLPDDTMKAMATAPPWTASREGTINQTGSLDYKAVLETDNTGNNQPMNVMHPYYSIYFIRRTLRIYYRA